MPVLHANLCKETPTKVETILLSSMDSHSSEKDAFSGFPDHPLTRKLKDALQNTHTLGATHPFFGLLRTTHVALGESVNTFSLLTMIKRFPLPLHHFRELFLKSFLAKASGVLDGLDRLK